MTFIADQIRIQKPAEPDDGRVKCTYCAGSGEVAYSRAFPHGYRGAGPVTEWARGVYGDICPACRGEGRVEPEVCSTCEGGGWESYGLGHGDPHFRECRDCANPEGLPSP